MFSVSVPIMPEYLYRLAHPNTSMYGPDSKSPQGAYVPCTTTPSSESTEAYDYYDETTPSDYAETEASAPKTTPCMVFDPNVTTTVDPEAEEQRHEYMTRENIYVGLMFGSKALIQLITNPFVGPMTNR